MNKINSKDIPNGFPLCVVTDCPIANHCLRQLAMQELTKKNHLVTIVNPVRTKPSEQCEYYRSDELQQYARGFTAMKAQMLPGQYKEFMESLKMYFGRTRYFQHRRGECLCSPKDIAVIRNLLNKLGLSHLEFDAYEQHYSWND